MHLDFAYWMEAQVCFCFGPETVQKLYLIQVRKFEFLWKMSLEKFGFTNSSVLLKKKKPKLTKKQETKFMMTKKRVRTFVPTWTETYPWVKFVEGKMYCNYVIDFNKSCIYWSINIDCYFLSSGQGKSILSHYFPLEKKKFLEHCINSLRN